LDVSSRALLPYRGLSGFADQIQEIRDDDDHRAHRDTSGQIAIFKVVMIRLTRLIHFESQCADAGVEKGWSATAGKASFR
jgi:hypothetical protein